MSETGEPFAQGEKVHLLKELRAGRQIHEIGTRARVLADHGAVLVLHLDGAEAEVTTCPKHYVARAVERPARTLVPRVGPARLRPSLG